MLFYLRNNLEADIPGAAGSTVGLTLGSCAPVLVSAPQFGDLRGDLRARRELFLSIRFLLQSVKKLIFS